MGEFVARLVARIVDNLVKISLFAKVSELFWVKARFHHDGTSVLTFSSLSSFIVLIILTQTFVLVKTVFQNVTAYFIVAQHIGDRNSATTFFSAFSNTPWLHSIYDL